MNKSRSSHITWLDKNKEHMRLYRKAYYAANKDRIKARATLWNKNNRSKNNVFVANWAAKNKDKRCYAQNKRRIAQIHRTPKWLTEKQLSEIQQFYIDSAYLTAYTKTHFSVDHIVPLQGSLVSGLHVPWNLQIMTRSENAKKHNKMGGYHR